jgi:hypothetical protein
MLDTLSCMKKKKSIITNERNKRFLLVLIFVLLLGSIGSGIAVGSAAPIFTVIPAADRISPVIPSPFSHSSSGQQTIQASVSAMPIPTTVQLDPAAAGQSAVTR